MEAASAADVPTEAVPGPLGQVSLLARDIGRVEAFYWDRLGLPHYFTVGDLAFFADGEGNTLGLMSQVPPAGPPS